jgi:hypothetical protein
MAANGVYHTRPLCRTHPETSLKRFISDKSYWDIPEDAESDRDTQMLLNACTKGAGREVLARAVRHRNLGGGDLRRLVSGGVGPHREDESLHAPIGFARYEDPTADPADYLYYHLADGRRVAIPRVTPSADANNLIQKIYHWGPQSAGYVRLGDTLVPAVLGPGDRRTLAGSGLDRCPF